MRRKFLPSPPCTEKINPIYIPGQAISQKNERKKCHLKIRPAAFHPWEHLEKISKMTTHEERRREKQRQWNSEVRTFWVFLFFSSKVQPPPWELLLLKTPPPIGGRRRGFRRRRHVGSSRIRSRFPPFVQWDGGEGEDIWDTHFSHFVSLFSGFFQIRVENIIAVDFLALLIRRSCLLFSLYLCGLVAKARLEGRNEG